MSWKVGLGDNHDDLDLQGEIDDSFFDSGSTPSAPCYPGPANGEPEHHTQDSISPFTPPNSLTTAAPVTTQELPMDSYRLPAAVGCSLYAVQGMSTDSHMNEASPYRGMEDDEESVSITDSDGPSSLSDGSMEGLSSESITDVTPLHSPYMCDSPIPGGKLPRSKLALPDVESTGSVTLVDSDTDSDNSCFGAKCKNRCAQPVKLSGKVRLGRGKQQRDSVDLQLLVDAIRRLEAHQCEQGHSSRTRKGSGEPPSVKGRKNMSFSNEEVQRIDRENQRLLKRILAQQNRPRPKFDSRTHSRLPPSAINRQRQQRQIEVENLALLKRIESAKPSREVTSSQELAHVERSRSHSLSLTRHHALPVPAVLTGSGVSPLEGISKHFPPRQKHHSH